MNKTLLCLAALAAATVSHAQEPRSSYSVTTDFTYSSEYVFRGQKLADDSIQPSVEVTVQNAYLGVWTNQPVTKHQDNELNVYGGYKYRLNENVSLEGVGTYYWYPEAKGALTRHAWEGGVGATYTLKGISSSVYYFHDFTRRSEIIQGSVGYSLPLEAVGASVDLSAFYGNVDSDNFLPSSGSKVHESYGYYGIDVAVPYTLSERAKVTLGGHWARNRNFAYATDGNMVWWTLGLTVGF